MRRTRVKTGGSYRKADAWDVRRRGKKTMSAKKVNIAPDFHRENAGSTAAFCFLAPIRRPGNVNWVLLFRFVTPSRRETKSRQSDGAENAGKELKLWSGLLCESPHRRGSHLTLHATPLPRIHFTAGWTWFTGKEREHNRYKPNITPHAWVLLSDWSKDVRTRLFIERFRRANQSAWSVAQTASNRVRHL